MQDHFNSELIIERGVVDKNDNLSEAQWKKAIDWESSPKWTGYAMEKVK